MREDSHFDWQLILKSDQQEIWDYTNKRRALL